mmetsp:Transcript_8874/g.9387  ORF Transcript_8874/g.9387 Transcript_8874/m.9387 type:complete len:109 (+) Transcript_8874:90-416(+)
MAAIPIQQLIALLEIDENTTRSAAKRNKKALNSNPHGPHFHFCLRCHLSFEDHGELRDHVRENGHKRKSERVKQYFREKSHVYDENPSVDNAQRKILALLYVTALARI